MTQIQQLGGVDPAPSVASQALTLAATLVVPAAFYAAGMKKTAAVVLLVSVVGVGVVAGVTR